MRTLFPLAVLALVGNAAAQGGPGGPGGPPGPPPLPPPGTPPVVFPAANPDGFAKRQLGRALFWDEQLSSTQTVACATCHIPSAGGSDPRSGAATVHLGADGVLGTADDAVGSPGVIANLPSGLYTKVEQFELGAQITGRKSPSMVNAAYSPLQFWDGRAGTTFEDPLTGDVLVPVGGSLEAQAAGPPVNDVEMSHLGSDWNDVVARLEGAVALDLAEDLPIGLEAAVGDRTYDELFEEVFGSPGITPERVAFAIATYERSLISDQSPWDDFLAGDTAALTPQQQQGQQIFFGPGRCDLCHNGQLLTDQAFHNIGVSPIFADEGRSAVTGNPADRGRFKTPGLRNVALRAPYFHNGSAETLADVVAFYDRGGDFALNQDPLIQPLGLSPGQRAALVAFLEALTDPRVANETGPFARPTLYSEGASRPTTFGSSSGGVGPLGSDPRMVAVEPAHLTNPDVTLAADDVRAGSPALLLFDLASLPIGLEVAGIDVHLGLTPLLMVVPAGVTQSFGLDPSEGYASFSFALDANPALVGTDLFAQWVFADPTGPQGLTSTEAVELPLF